MKLEWKTCIRAGGHYWKNDVVILAEVIYTIT